MNNINHTKEQAREFLKQEALKEINGYADFTKFQGRTFCVVAKYGLQLEATIQNKIYVEKWIDMRIYRNTKI